MITNLDKYREFKELQNKNYSIINSLDNVKEMLYNIPKHREVESLLDALVRTKITLLEEVEIFRQELNGVNLDENNS